MPKAENTFRPVGDSDNKMHGATAILVSGFSVEEQHTLRTLMDTTLALDSVPAIYITADSLEQMLGTLAALPAETGAGETAALPRAIIMSGLPERDLHTLMRGYRESELPRPLWATVTPTSENWTIKALLIELLQEREAMRKAREAQVAGDNNIGEG